MSASRQRQEGARTIPWEGLSRQLASLNPLTTAVLPGQLAQLCGGVFEGGAAHLLFFNGEDGHPGDIFSSSPLANADAVQQLLSLAEKSAAAGKAVHIKAGGRRGSDVPELGNASALPLLSAGSCFAALCFVGLAAAQQKELTQLPPAAELALGQLQQLALLYARSSSQTAPEPVSSDELNLLSMVAEKLEQGIDARSVYARFVELLHPALPVELLAVLHCHGDDTRGIVCPASVTARSEAEQVFALLTEQWQRRHQRRAVPEFGEALVVGEELLRTSRRKTAQASTVQTEVLPIFFDGDLFALVAVRALPDLLGDRRRVRLLSLLLRQLLSGVRHSQLLEQNSSLQTLDTLTGLYNERHFFQMLEREYDRARRYRVPLSLHVFDVDHFKDVNEAYGFETGDLLLREISRILMENVRNTDLVSRYGGERFLLLLPETPGKNSEILANRLRRFVENFSFYIPNTNVFIKVTVSGGVASFLEHEPASVAQFIEFADTALYFAKRNGRNQVVGYGYVLDLMLNSQGHHG